MRNAIEAIFDEINDKEVSFDNLRDEIKKIVIENFKQNMSSKNLLDSITNISLDIISASFDKQKLFSGNIDSQKIKKTAIKYGFSYETKARKTKNGSDLLTVKTNRNDLSHGLKSFEEIGKNAGVEELLQIQKRVISYLKGTLENIETYIDKREYLQEH